jgi:hypothetical protein
VLCQEQHYSYDELKISNMNHSIFHSCTMHLDIIKVLFISPTDALYIYYIKIKIYIKIHMKVSPTCFGLTAILREHIIDLS